MKINITHILSEQQVADILATQGQMATESKYDVCKRFVRNAVKDSAHDMHRILEEERQNQVVVDTVVANGG
jgi:Mg2+/Co2+ transporter CorC